MTRLGIIGSGAIGAHIARLAVAAGHEIVLANSRGPESLDELVQELGTTAAAGSVAEAATFGDLVVLAIPLSAYRDLPADILDGRTVLSTGNYYPSRDGRIPELDSSAMTTAEHETQLLPGAIIVKAFNNIVAHHIPTLARAADASDRTALPVAGDDDVAKDAVSTVVQTLGFDTVDAGSLAESWRFEPESGAYTSIYAADEEGFAADYVADQGRPLSADRLRERLAASHRPDVAGRTF